MIDHRRARLLMAAAIDHALDPRERGELEQHLRVCETCREFGEEMRRDAAELRAMPLVDAPAAVREGVLWSAEDPTSRGRQPISRPMMVLLAGALLVAALATGAVAGALLNNRDQSLLPDAEGSASPTTVETSSPTATSTPSPAEPDASPVPTPIGTLQEIAVNGWATVTVGELNVRAEPGLDAASVTKLVQGAVADVLEGPRGADGYSWYRIVSLDGATGWAASGTQDEPFLATLARSADLVQCSQVTAPVFASGTVNPLEAVHIGQLTLPATLFDDGELGGFELARAIQHEVCITAVRGEPVPTVYVEMGFSACGHPLVAGDHIELHPIAGMDVVGDQRVRDVVVVHPAVLDPKSLNDTLTADMIAIMRWMSLDPRSWGCLQKGIYRSPGRDDGGIQLDIRGCGVIVSQTADQVIVRGPTSDEEITLGLTPGSTVNPAVATGQPVGIIAWGFDDLNLRKIDLAPYGAPCP